jgi:hypothetical protein
MLTTRIEMFKSNLEPISKRAAIFGVSFNPLEKQTIPLLR